MNIADVMDQLGAQLDTISTLRVYPYQADHISPPAAIIEMPLINYDQTYVRGSDRLTVPIWLIVDRVNDRTVRDRIVKYMDGSGADSIKAVLESGSYTAFDSIRVLTAEPQFIFFNQVNYQAVEFTVDIFGGGA